MNNLYSCLLYDKEKCKTYNENCPYVECDNRLFEGGYVAKIYDYFVVYRKDHQLCGVGLCGNNKLIFQMKKLQFKKEYKKSKVLQELFKRDENV